MKRIAILSVLCFAFVGCKTTTKVEYRDRYIDNYITRVQHDTIRESVTDSVYFEVLQKGDTIYQTKYKEVIKWRDRVVEKIDTCYKDSIITEYKESVKEIKYVPKIYKISMAISIFLLIFALIKLALWLKTRSII
jgi:hypothetical protein